MNRDWLNLYYRKIPISESGLPVNIKLATFQMFFAFFRRQRDPEKELRSGHKTLFCIAFSPGRSQPLSNPDLPEITPIAPHQRRPRARTLEPLAFSARSKTGQPDDSQRFPQGLRDGVPGANILYRPVFYIVVTDACRWACTRDQGHRRHPGGSPCRLPRLPRA